MAGVIGRVRALRRRLGGERGAELIEFALTLPILLLVVLGIIEFGFVFREYEVVTNAAREGARIAVLPAYSSTEAARKDNATARMTAYLTNAGLTASVPVGTCPLSSSSAGMCVGDPAAAALSTGSVCTVTVQVNYPHPVTFVGGILRYFGGSMAATLTLRARSTMRTEVAASSCS